MFFLVETKGFCDIINITEKVNDFVKRKKVKDGAVLIFMPGSTAGITTIEYEEGVIKDLKNFFEKIIPQNEKYYHEEAWHDGNGFSHIRSAILKPFLVVPIEDNNLVLGTWQQIVLIDFDNKPRQRKIYLKFLASKLD